MIAMLLINNILFTSAQVIPLDQFEQNPQFFIKEDVVVTSWQQSQQLDIDQQGSWILVPYPSMFIRDNDDQSWQVIEQTDITTLPSSSWQIITWIQTIHDPQQQKMFEEIQAIRKNIDNKQEHFFDELYESQQDIPFDVEQAQKRLIQLQQDTQSLIKQIETLNKQKWSGDQQHARMMKEVQKVIDDMNETARQVSYSLQKLAITQKNIITSLDEIKSIRQSLSGTKQFLVRFTYLLYMVHNDLYTNDMIDDIKLLIKSNDVSQTLSQEYMLNALINKVNQLIDSIKQAENKHIDMVKRLNALKVKMRYDIVGYEWKFIALQQKKLYLSEFLNLYKNNKIKLTGEIDRLFDTRKDAEEMIKTISQQISNGIYDAPFDMKQALAQLNDMPEKNPSPTFLSRPVLPVNTITTFFGEPWFKQRYGHDSVGIEVPVPQWTPIYAPANGIVYRVFDRDGIALNRIVLVHKHNLVTAYLYINSAVVKPWDIVQRGQIIWYSWWEPWTRWAWFVSRWSNVTFQLFRHGRPQDPLLLLDLSVLRDKTMLSEQMQIKYVKNKYERRIDLSNVKIMPGDTILARRINFLNTYGVGIFRNHLFWEEAADGMNIDVDLGICIGFAESTIGRYLATDNNIGNVWNNDRWDRVPYESPQAGGRAIYYTLNNRFLGNYHTIDRLSWRWNKDGKVYASSPINWMNNVMRCLTMIKWYRVPEEYPFRTGPNPFKR